MKVFYSIEIQTNYPQEINEEIVQSAMKHLGFEREDYEDEETYSASYIFAAMTKPSEMEERAKRFMQETPGVHYVDIAYRYEYAMVPDRFVIWDDGKIQHYTGYITYREDE